MSRRMTIQSALASYEGESVDHPRIRETAEFIEKHLSPEQVGGDDQSRFIFALELIQKSGTLEEAKTISRAALGYW